MAKSSKWQVVQRLFASGLIPQFSGLDREVMHKVAAALASAGCPVFQFAHGGESSVALFAELAAYVNQEFPTLVVGAAAVEDTRTAQQYLSSGAQFIASGAGNFEIAKLCNRHKTVYLPGCASPAEMSAAEEWGCDLVKLTPGGMTAEEITLALSASGVGHSLIKTIPEPFNRAAVADWFNAGGALIEVDSSLWIAAGDFEALSAFVGEVRGWISAARGEPVFTGIEHVGIGPGGDAAATAEWYAKTFGFAVQAGNSSIFICSGGPGRIEIAKAQHATAEHIAIEVTDYAAAVAQLLAQGIALEEPKISPAVKAVYLRDPDPAGNRVHIMWRR